jgi:hypothetical protein
MLGWSKSYLTSGSNSIASCQNLLTATLVYQGSHLGPLFFIDVVEHVSALGYAENLKLFMTINYEDDCIKFQSDLNGLQQWCIKNLT